MIDRVTITGADDDTDINRMIEISLDYPFVEWGILVGSRTDARFPSTEWMWQLYRAKCTYPLMLSLHLCGRYLREAISTAEPFTIDPILMRGFERIQLNFHGLARESLPYLGNKLRDWHGHKWIFQLDGVNDRFYREYVKGPFGSNIQPLHDTSHGAGEIPNKWTMSEPGVYTGYAGGLGPDTIEEQWPWILTALGPGRGWIDMETRVRTNEILDLEKVRAVLNFVRNRF